MRISCFSAMLLAVFCGVACLSQTVVADDEAGFVPIFNGKDLNGWKGDAELWVVKEGMLVGDSVGIKQNQFLTTTKTYGDFELRLEFRLHGGKGNSGVQFRSKRVPKSTAVIGYQADIGENYWGALYDEHRRRKVLARPTSAQEKFVKKADWNSYVIRAVGRRILLKINGETMVDYTETDDSIARSGIIALQVHSGPAMRIDFRKMRIRKLGER